jgi:hypothetical protein
MNGNRSMAVAIKTRAASLSGSANRSRFFALMLPLAIVVSADAALAQGLIGRVRDRNTRVPIPAVELRLYSMTDELVARAISDDTGRFVLKATQPGRYRVVTNHIGFTSDTLGPVRLYESVMTESDIHLTTTAIRLDAVLVSAPRSDAALYAAGYYARKKLGFGKFLDPDKIATRNASRLDQVLQGTPGVHIVPMPNGRFTVAVRGGVAGSCIPPVYLDGIAQSNFDWHTVHASEVAAIEVYRSALEAPAQFKAKNCGAVLLWSKR